MPSPEAFALAVKAYPLMALFTFSVLLFIDAPYGRHIREGWGPTMSAPWTWLVMESPSVVLPAVLFWSFSPTSAAAWVLFGLWQLHYLQRAFLYPLLLKGGKGWPVVIVALAFVFNLYNAGVNHYWLGTASYGPEWLWDPRMLLGGALFLGGFALNLHSDQVLRTLKAEGQGYQIPRGGLFRWVSCPNYLGEMLEWFGFALAAWSAPALFFALYTVSNLGPRAMAHHRWYHERFPDYPPERKALIPGLI